MGLFLYESFFDELKIEKLLISDNNLLTSLKICYYSEESLFLSKRFWDKGELGC